MSFTSYYLKRVLIYLNQSTPSRVIMEQWTKYDDTLRPPPSPPPPSTLTISYQSIPDQSNVVIILIHPLRPPSNAGQ